ncbi:flp pilus-assembly TadE/G-like family protein [Corynebacterium propinquum]|uniref:Flp pilus-assembly TadE/G-like family protein n=1 Tax=Corynebacterium propinquum TaxID=43769 RepID=A0AAP4C024_9CORY|nr:Rv3654c family TadE-like protein [Corynebacterium propinquum]MDK4326537.1 flp pilus-assembly TadE/G-like family protein [Corynebacterium propinquum]MDK8723517.1 flp pilus-assembly TadE/G-like family protein [Corynebacterium propinquum]
MKPTNNGGHKQRLPRFQRLVYDANDDGYATVAAAGIIVAIVAVSLSLIGVASHVVARHQGQLAADMAAVAGAEAFARGEPPCPAARETAEANHATVDSCRTDNRDVLVEVTAGVSVTSASARGRAGPL